MASRKGNGMGNYMGNIPVTYIYDITHYDAYHYSGAMDFQSLAGKREVPCSTPGSYYVFSCIYRELNKLLIKTQENNVTIYIVFSWATHSYLCT